MKLAIASSILVVSYYAPSRGHAGGLRLLDLYSEIRRLAPYAKLELLTCEHPSMDWGDSLLNEVFDAVHWVTADGFKPGMIAALSFTAGPFDFVDLQFHQSGAMIGACRRRWPGATIAFSPMESRIRSLFGGWHGDTGRVLKRLRRLRLGDIWSALQEGFYVRRADKVIVVSEPDFDVLVGLRDRQSFHCVPTGLSEREYRGAECPTATLENAFVVFSAYFGSQTNREALEWYCRFVHPLVRKAIPNYVLKVVGRGLDESLMRLCSGTGIEFVGQVDFIYEALIEASLGIAPALSGAGVRGKIHQYAAVGLPCVASPIALDGLGYSPGESILVASDPNEFAQKCAFLLRNPEARRRIGLAARNLCNRCYTWRSMERAISATYGLA